MAVICWRSEFILASQTGLVNAPAVAWDLVPYSFVLDFFLDLQSWIQSTTALSGLNFIEGSKVTTVIRSTEVAPGNIIRTVGSVDRECILDPEQINLPYNLDYSSTVRERLTEAPVRNLSYLRVPDTWWHAITMTTLVIKRLKSL